ncbi:uncharacterized protein MONOS_18637 [Monocercomonoides exilis]|uniref:uncharacterized protein n=1 Tax=Monocercomonoides exilis TaxID=2049356 RepID=UPI003559AFE6|nr:hypothetical protein MONOS_18637 [Monocercomonoides exilis]
MEMHNKYKSNDDIQEPSLEDKISNLFSELDIYKDEEQKQKIEELNEIIEGMNKEMFDSVFKTELYDKMNKMIEEKKMSMENAILLLKHIGYSNVLKNMWNSCFHLSSLGKKLKNMAEEEEKKEKEKRNEKLLIDFCECYILLSILVNSELILICVPCLLKAALKKEESEETQKEVEMALLALSNIGQFKEIEQKQYLKEIKEIIQYHQKHNNHIRLAYQSAWQFFIDRFYSDKSLERVIVNELHFAREAARELEELTKCLNWKNKFEEMSKEEANEVLVIRRWIQTLEIFFSSCQLWNEELVELFRSIVRVFRAAKDNHREICYWCIFSLRSAAENRNVEIDDLLKSGAIDAFLEEMHRRTLNEGMVYECLQFFTNVSNRLKEKKDNEMEEVKRKATKMEIFEKLEEEGYEDTITSFYEVISIRFIYNPELLLNIYDYFVNV